MYLYFILLKLVLHNFLINKITNLKQTKLALDVVVCFDSTLLPSVLYYFEKKNITST